MELAYPLYLVSINNLISSASYLTTDRPAIADFEQACGRLPWVRQTRF